MRPLKDETWLNVARELSRQSTCLRRAVGCVLLDSRGHVASTGWNGVASKQLHCNERVADWRKMDLEPEYPYACLGAMAASGTNLDACQAIHAEQNALIRCRDVYDLSICYVTASPCITCVKLLLGTSCTRVVFLEDYPHPAAKNLWLNAGRAWEKGSV